MKIDLPSMFKQYGIKYQVGDNGWINVCCPNCNDTKYHGGFNLNEFYYNCWRCGGINAKDILQKLLNLSFNDLNILLNENTIDKIVLNKLNKTQGKIHNIELPGSILNEKERKYLIKRNFDPYYLVDTYKIQGGGIIGEWNFRIIIPVFYQNKLVTFLGRTIVNNEIRYRNLKTDKAIISNKKILYNLDNCMNNYIILVEGPFDCWRLGHNNVSCSFGIEITPEQINLLSKRFKKVIFLFDNEKMAQDRARKYGEQLSALGVEVEIFNPEFEHDPGDYTKDEENIVRKELNIET
jgi:DNA primase